MTMPYASHPDDERLAAYADREADALQDRDLTAHISTCDRCGEIFEDLVALPSLLAALPDVIPSRPLQLLPPVPEPAARPVGGGVGWLRGLTGTAIAAGSGLVLVGAIGASGILGELSWQASLAGPDRASVEENYGPAAGSGKEQASPPETALDSSGGQVAPSADDGDTTRDTSAFDLIAGPDGAWLAMVLAGVALILAAGVLRYVLQPRAG